MKAWEKLALWFLFTFVFCGCATPEVKADPKAQAQAGAVADSQAGSNAGVKLRGGARHIGVSVTPAVDGGAPTFKLEVDDEADEAEADSSAEADGGSDAQADAGAAAPISIPVPKFWTAGKFAIAGLIGLLAVAGVAFFKLKKFPWVP